MIVRWMGAYGKSVSLLESLRFELSNLEYEVAAERIYPGARVRTSNGSLKSIGSGGIQHAVVGLWLDKAAWVKGYPGDVWSQMDLENPGRLCPTRWGRFTPHGHTEAFCKPGHVKGIVLKKHPSALGPATLEALQIISVEHDLPVFYLNKKGKRTKVTDEIRRYRPKKKHLPDGQA